ncbi:MAG TPA: cytochrome d ubiquinol oxidase subunit II [Solirubrobacteraceae bacterium]|nr:cytochrome d ubiquinol oxidase subunit II [Solirubrobacteraceae bacterium]
MHLYVVPLLFVLAGLVFYTVLGGADFGAGIWQLIAGSGESGDRIRQHAHESMAPVWEANHVWLIFVITVTWTAYPMAFGSIASTLSIPLFIAALGIILRGATYALRAGATTPAEARRIDTAFAISSLLTPFTLGTCIGALAARRVPIGNAAGKLFSSWLNPTSVVIGVIAVLSSAYLASVYLAADGARRQDPQLEDAFRGRALVAGVLAGAAAAAGLIVIDLNAPFLFRGLTSGGGLVALIVSFLAGLGAIVLVWLRRFEPARYVAALTVAAVVAGWGLAQQPIMLEGLTVRQAAAPYDTLVVIVGAVVAGGVILFPSLALLFRLFLSGHLGETAADFRAPVTRAPGTVRASLRAGLARLALAAFLAGLILVVFIDAEWGQLLGAACLIACVVLGFVAVDPPAVAGRGDA